MYPYIHLMHGNVLMAVSSEHGELYKVGEAERKLVKYRPSLGFCFLLFLGFLVAPFARDMRVCPRV